MAKKREQEKDGAAVIYARYSSHAQREASIEQQFKKCLEFAEKSGLEVAHMYSDKAITGKTDRRADFQQMMRDASRGKFQYVIAWKSNRMGRNMLEAMMNDVKLREMGIRCLYVEEDFEDNAAGRFALRNMMNVNQFYSENMAEDIMRGMMDNAQSCMTNGGVLPYGYRRGKDGKFEIVEEEAAIVREIFIKVKNDVPFVDIASEFNSRGIKTRKRAAWNKNSFAKILTNERYLGIYLWGDIRIENGMPQIIDEELFESVQEKLKTKANPRGRHRVGGDYLLTGKLFCGKCGAPMVGMSGTSGTAGRKHYYYACQNARAKKMCEKKAARRDDVELMVAEAVRKYIMQDDVIQWMVDCCEEFQKNTFESQQLAADTKQLASIKVSIKNLVDAIANGLYTESTKERLLELESEKKRVERSISVQTCGLKPYDRDAVQFYLESFRDGEVEDKQFQRRLFDQFVDAVYLYEDEFRVVFSGTESDVRIPFGTVDKAEEIAESSVRLSSPMLHQRKKTPQGVFFL